MRQMRAIHDSRLVACPQGVRAAAWMGIAAPRVVKDMLRLPPYIELTPYLCARHPHNLSHRQGLEPVRCEPRMIPASVSRSKFLDLPRGHRQENR
jgi:hypothetical protein